MRDERLHYVALGDSTARGHGAREGGYPEHLCARLSRRGIPTRLTNLGVDGAKTRDLRTRQLGRAIGHRPDLVTVGIGINDMAWGLSVEHFGRELGEVVGRLCAVAGQVVVTEFPDLSLAPIANLLGNAAHYRERVVEFNAVIAHVTREHGAALVEVHPQSQRLLPSHPEFFSPDGFHPSDEGYAAWAEMMWPAVEAAASRCSAQVRGPVAG